jgi:hypothetical protein
MPLLPIVRASSCFHSIGRIQTRVHSAFSISALKYVYAFSLAFPQEGGARPPLLRVCQSLRALCPTLTRVSRGMAEPSTFSRYGCRSSLLSDFRRRPCLFCWVAKPSVSPAKVLQYASKDFTVQKRT